jgi:hypothetical protein
MTRSRNKIKKNPQNTIGSVADYTRVSMKPTHETRHEAQAEESYEESGVARE